MIVVFFLIRKHDCWPRSALDYWYSYKVTMWLYAWVKLFGLGLMVVLLSPNYAEKNFAVSAPSQLVQGGFEKL